MIISIIYLSWWPVKMPQEQNERNGIQKNKKKTEKETITDLEFHTY